MILWICSISLNFWPILIGLHFQDMISNLNSILLFAVFNTVIDSLFEAASIWDNIDIWLRILTQILFIYNRWLFAQTSKIIKFWSNMSKSGSIICVILIYGAKIGLPTELQKPFDLMWLHSSQHAFITWAIFANPFVRRLVRSTNRSLVVLKLALRTELVVTVATFLGSQRSVTFYTD